MRLSLTLLFFGILILMSIEDYKTKLVNPLYCIIAYLSSLGISVLNKQSIGHIIFSSLWFCIFLCILEVIYRLITNKINNSSEVVSSDDTAEENVGVGFGDIMLVPALTLFAGSNSLESMLIAFSLALVYSKVKSENFTPLVPFFTIGIFLGVYVI